MGNPRRDVLLPGVDGLCGDKHHVAAELAQPGPQHWPHLEVRIRGERMIGVDRRVALACKR